MAFTAILLLASGPENARAQKQRAFIAVGSSKGIFISLGSVAALPNLTGKPVSYLIERKSEGAARWDAAAEVAAPKTEAELASRIAQAARYLPFSAQPDSLQLKTIWQRLQRFGHQDSLGQWGRLTTIRMAIGTTYLDTAASPRVRYEYRVSTLGPSHQVIASALSQFAQYPWIPEFGKPQLLYAEGEDRRVNLQWRAVRTIRPDSYRVFRQKNQEGAFEEIVPFKLFASRRDTLIYAVIDTLVARGQVYRYYIVPVSVYGDAGFASDTALVGAYDFRSVPLPRALKLERVDSSGGIRLQWQLSATGLVRSIRVFRCPKFDGAYEQVAELPADAAAFVDQGVEPMKKYFYALAITGPLGEVSPMGARVFGEYQSSAPPLPPWISRSEGLKTGVRLEIISHEPFTEGYRVYRVRSGGEPFQLISGLVPRRDSVTVYLDTASVLSGRSEYMYAVRSENTSHVMSGFSDTVRVRPLISTHPQAPVELSASVDSVAIQLYWRDMWPMDPALDGYHVYRRVTGEKEFRRLTDTLLAVRHNRFRDTTVQGVRVYQYAVRSVDIFGGVSELSTSVSANVPRPLPISPAGLRAEMAGDAVVLRWDPPVQTERVSYRVHRYQRGKEDVVLATVDGNTTEYVDKSTRQGELYFYTVTCVTRDGIESTPFTEISVQR
jgi:hypothetical protein